MQIGPDTPLGPLSRCSWPCLMAPLLFWPAPCTPSCHCKDHCNDTMCFAGDVDATFAYGFDSIKLDGCGQEENVGAPYSVCTPPPMVRPHVVGGGGGGAGGAVVRLVVLDGDQAGHPGHRRRELSQRVGGPAHCRPRPCQHTFRARFSSYSLSSPTPPPPPPPSDPTYPFVGPRRSTTGAPSTFTGPRRTSAPCSAAS